ncbi:MAG: hypothetical protein R2690_18400 [Acidimicrobiales bacterium]
MHIVDAATFTEKAFLKTGRGAHGLYPSRDGKQLYVINRGANTFDVPSGPGGITIIDFATNEIVEQHPIPGGGSPDMGCSPPTAASCGSAVLPDHVVYVFDTQTKEFTHQIEVGRGPHGLTVASRSLQPGPHRQHAVSRASRISFAGLATAVLTVGAGACAAPVLGARRVAQAVRDQANGVELADVVCPPDVAASAGATFECVATGADGTSSSP